MRKNGERAHSTIGPYFMGKAPSQSFTQLWHQQPTSSASHVACFTSFVYLHLHIYVFSTSHIYLVLLEFSSSCRTF